MTQTVWLPASSGPVSQQPFLKNPVMGLIEQDASFSPNTFREGPGPRPIPLGSNDMTFSFGRTMALTFYYGSKARRWNFGSRNQRKFPQPSLDVPDKRLNAVAACDLRRLVILLRAPDVMVRFAIVGLA